MRTTESDTTYGLLLPALSDAVRAAGELLRNADVPSRLTTFEEMRSAFERVEAPLVAELHRRLDPLRPGASWLDEFPEGLPATGEFWSVDPLDGLVQYVQGLPQFCVSVALVQDGEAVAAALYSPLLKETYLAARGGGATLDGRPVGPSAKTDLALSVAATSHPPFPGTQPDAARRAGTGLAAVLPHVAAVRNLGPTSWQIADTGAGRLDAFWEYGSDLGNLLAGALVAREAGAAVTDASGRPWHGGAGSFLASAPGLHGALVDLLREADPGAGAAPAEPA